MRRALYLQIIMALPFGSAATYSPGTARRQPVRPNTSQCTIFQQLPVLSYSTIEIVPESDPITT